jgi:hypothetical protein
VTDQLVLAIPSLNLRKVGEDWDRRTWPLTFVEPLESVDAQTVTFGHGSWPLSLLGTKYGAVADEVVVAKEDVVGETAEVALIGPRAQGRASCGVVAAAGAIGVVAVDLASESATLVVGLVAAGINPGTGRRTTSGEVLTNFDGVDDSSEKDVFSISPDDFPASAVEHSFWQSGIENKKLNQTFSFCIFLL